LNLTRIAEATGMTAKEAANWRAEYLRAHMAELAETIDWFMEEAKAATGDDRRLCELFAMGEVDVYFAELRELRRLTRTINGQPPAPGRITDEQIAAARSYPIEQVIDFVRGKAPAPCHEDKNPSLSWDRKRNRAHCFVCHKDFSALDYLIEHQGLKFVDAVKRLAA